MPAPVPAQPPTAARTLQPLQPLQYSTRPSRRQSVWRLAPRRCAWLVAAWVLAVGALFVPGCDMSDDRSELRPTYVAYGLSAMYVRMFGEAVVEYASGTRPNPPEAGGAAMSLACALFYAASAVFVASPLLLRRRVLRGFGGVGWTAASLLLSPWAMPLVAAAGGTARHYVEGFYLLAAAHTVAFAVLLWPGEKPVNSPSSDPSPAPPPDVAGGAAG